MALGQRRPPPPNQEAASVEYFAGLWVVGQALLRSQTRRLWQVLATKMPVLDPLMTLDIPVRILERVSVGTRITVVSAAAWLLEDWPDRFLHASARARMGTTCFIATRAHHPSWMQDALEDRLRQRLHLTSEQVGRAVRTLQQDGTKLTKLRLRQMLGVSESKEISRAVAHRRSACGDEFNALVSIFERAIEEATTSRDHKLTLSRDYLIFRLSVASNQPIETICRLPLAEYRQLASGHRPGAPFVSEEIRHQLEHLLEQYVTTIRTKFVNGRARSELFLSRSGLPLKGHSVRARVSKLMEQNLEASLWRSADAFLFPKGG